MSYARMSRDSDVYVYRSSRIMSDVSIFVCCSCRLTTESTKTFKEIGSPVFIPAMTLSFYEDYVFESQEEMIDHLLVHRETGHKVPQRTLDRLISEITGGINA